MVVESSYLVVDYIVFVLIVIFSIVVPLWRKSKSKDTKDNYVFAKTGGMATPTLMVLSICRGIFGVKFLLGFPSEMYYYGITMWETIYGMIIGNLIIAYLFIPVYFSLDITSVFEYLDLRFKSKTIRLLASAVYVIRTLLNLGITVFTPCLALNIIMGFPYWASIMGVVAISIVFNLFGGLSAAIKADAMQFITTLIIIIGVVIQCCIELKGFSPIFEISAKNDRLNFFQFKWDPTVRIDTFTATVGQIFISTTIIGCQQNFVQRYKSMKSESVVVKTLLWSIPIIFILLTLFSITGFGIFAVYENCDPLTSGYTKKIDEILPFFVEDKFQYIPGAMGFFVANLFTGALSVAISNINSIATVTWEDFLLNITFFKNFKDKQQLRMIRLLGVIFGLITMVIGFGVEFLSGIMEGSMLLTSTMSGPLLGIFLLAMIVPCANRRGAVVGMIVGQVITMWAAVGHLISDPAKNELLPLSVEGCKNDSFSTYIMNSTKQWENQSEYSEITQTLTNTETDPIKVFYLITYMYYGLIGTFLTVFVGTFVSLFTKTSKEEAYDRNLLHPWVLKAKYKMFPRKRGKLITALDVSNVKKIYSISTYNKKIDT